MPRCRIELISASARTDLLGGEDLAGRLFKILTPRREYVLKAKTSREASEWICHIQATIQNIILESSAAQMAPVSTGWIAGGAHLVAELISSIPGNEACADCNAVLPGWASINLGLFLCIECSGVHRSLGCQASKVRSLELDKFLPETIALLKHMGNRNMNAIWEADVQETLKSKIQTDPQARAAYIRDKYVQRAFS